jgi:D-alanyl-D-alanine carboxypeptidase (penicillin-binding protein 5/6)
MLTTNGTSVEDTTTTTTTTRPTIAVNAPLSSARIVLYDKTHSSLLYSINADEQCSPASLTKLLTASLAVEYCSADEVFTVGTEISLLEPDSSTAGLQQGYQLTRDMIINALLLPSGNDAAYTIAAHVGRLVSSDESLSDIAAVRIFIGLMNDKLAEIGATNSHFSDPDGYYSSDHYTTAYDMLLITEHAMQYDIIRTTVAQTSVSFTLLSGEPVQWYNSNVMLFENSAYYLQGITGMKTGYTNEAGYCVVVSAEQNGMELIGVVMGATTSDSRWSDALSLMEQGFAAEEVNQ